MMGVYPLANLKSSSNVFIDANILIYALTDRSAQCKEFLERCSRQDVFGICAYFVLVEATHRFMVAEAFAKRYIPSEKGAVKRLESQPHIVRTLRDYWENVLQIMKLNVLFVSLSDAIVRTAQKEREDNGLLTNDSLIVSSMRDWGIDILASHDEAFGQVDGIQVYSPDDI